MSSDKAIASTLGQLFTELSADLRASYPEADFSGLEALFQGIQQPALEYFNLLKAWTEKIDLIGPGSDAELLERHLVDSFAACVMTEQLLSPPISGAILDIGSGGGLPGLVFAIAYPERDVVLCEPREKRCIFLKEARRSLGLENLAVACERIEDFSADAEIGLTITRAFGQEELFLSQSARLLNGSGYAVSMVGPSWQAPQAEITGLCYRELLAYRLHSSREPRGLAVWSAR